MGRRSRAGFFPFRGNARLLANGNVEFDECAPTFPTQNAAIYQVTKTTPSQTVWQMQMPGQFAYRGLRIPSLYPSVQWQWASHHSMDMGI
jgi:hypothetical protein